MMDFSSTPLFLGENPVAGPMPHAAPRASLAVVSAAGAGLTAVLLMMSVAVNSGSEAERIAEARDDGYVATLASALATNLSMPLR